MKEEYRDVKGYEGFYQVSDYGNVKSLLRFDSIGRLRRCMVLKPTMVKGYPSVNLSKQGKQVTQKIHVLVAETFLNHTRQGHILVVDHIDNDKLNNKLSNLQIITNRENLTKDSKGSSKYAGVYWRADIRKWRATISVNNNRKSLGHFDCETKAHLAYQLELSKIK